MLSRQSLLASQLRQQFVTGPIDWSKLQQVHRRTHVPVSRRSSPVSNSLVTGLGAGTGLQILMVVVGHFVPSLQAMGLFPIAGTLIGGVTGWLAAKGPGAVGAAAGTGAVAGGVAGAIGSLVSTALGDVPLANIAIAGGATVVSGAIGAVLSRVLGGTRS